MIVGPYQAIKGYTSGKYIMAMGWWAFLIYLCVKIGKYVF